MTLALRVPIWPRRCRGPRCFVLGVVYIFGAWRCAIGLREINPHWLMIALLVSWAGDTAALYIGGLRQAQARAAGESRQDLGRRHGIGGGRQCSPRAFTRTT